MPEKASLPAAISRRGGKVLSTVSPAGSMDLGKRIGAFQGSVQTNWRSGERASARKKGPRHPDGAGPT